MVAIVPFLWLLNLRYLWYFQHYDTLWLLNSNFWKRPVSVSRKYCLGPNKTKNKITTDLFRVFSILSLHSKPFSLFVVSAGGPYKHVSLKIRAIDVLVVVRLHLISNTRRHQGTQQTLRNSILVHPAYLIRGGTRSNKNNFGYRSAHTTYFIHWNQLAWYF